jgi:mannose-1-phosphate guanylyltransferase
VKAFLLAGGHGTRLRPLTDTVPKCLVPIRGRPLLDLWLDLCARSGVTDVLINLHAGAKIIERHLQRSRPPVNVHVVHEETLLGSAGTLAANRSWIDSDAAFWIFYSDVLTNTNLKRMSEFHSRHGGVATLGLNLVPDPSRCGVAITDHRGVITDFEEKPRAPRSNWVFSGIMMADRRFFDAIPACLPADIAIHVLPRLLGKMQAYPIADYLLDIGTLPNYEKAQLTWPGIDGDLASPKQASPNQSTGQASFDQTTAPVAKNDLIRSDFMTREGLRGVVFDMDGVLVDSHAVHREAWRRLFETLACEVPERELDFILDGRKRSDILRHFLGDCPAAELEEFGRRKDCIFRQMRLEVAPIRGAVRMVREFHDSGIAVALATSASRSRARSTLLGLGLLDCFRVVVTGEDVGLGKPDPAVYQLACARLEMEPDCLLAVEDAISGIKAAVRAGLSCLGVASHETPENLVAAGAVYVVGDFEAVSKGELESIFNGREPVSRRAAAAAKA